MWKESQEMEFGALTRDSWALLMGPMRTMFYIAICCQKLIVFPSVGFFEDSVCHWQEMDWGTLCYVFGLSHFCKCVNGSLNRRCFATVDSDQRPNFPQCKLTVNHFWLRCCPRMPIWPADKPEIRNVTGFPKPAHTRGGVKWKLSMAYQIPKVAILFSYFLSFLPLPFSFL